MFVYLTVQANGDKIQVKKAKGVNDQCALVVQSDFLHSSKPQYTTVNNICMSELTPTFGQLIQHAYSLEVRCSI